MRERQQDRSGLYRVRVVEAVKSYSQGEGTVVRIVKKEINNGHNFNSYSYPFAHRSATDLGI